MLWKCAGVLTGCLVCGAVAFGEEGAATRGSGLKFSFGHQVEDYKLVSPSDEYTDARGYGFDLGSKVWPVFHGGWVSGVDHPIFFSVRVAPGTYEVAVTVGGRGEMVTTVKAETRRLMLENVRTKWLAPKRETFLVHVRVPTLPDGSMVRLKAREKDPILYVQWGEKRVPFTELDWDGKLTLEFSGSMAVVQGVEISPAATYTTVFLIGDSTVTDQMMEPWAAWGQMLPRWFKEPVVVANYAESGETTASFIGEKRWAKVMTEVKAGDYVFMQFGINDRRIPIEKFKGYFEQFIKDTRAKGATPVLVTSQNLKKLDEAGRGVETLGEYPQAMRDVAKAEGAALIDLNAMSEKLYEAVGAEKLGKVFVDGTHQTDYGAYELAKCVVQGVVDAGLPLKEDLSGEWVGFDPSKPDSLEKFELPVDPQLDPARPGGPGLANGQGPMGGGATRPATR